MWIYIKQLGLGYIKQLAYKKRSHLNTESYSLSGFVEVIFIPLWGFFIEMQTIASSSITRLGYTYIEANLK